MKITETESETKEIERTTTVEKIKCDVCAHSVDADDWDGHEFSVDPDVNREAHALRGLSEMFDAYHTSIPREVVKKSDEDIVFDVPKRELFDVVSEEVSIELERQKRVEEKQFAIETLKREYIEKLETDQFYLVDGEIHHFKYVLNAEASTEEHKHVCADCYEVIFD